MKVGTADEWGQEPLRRVVFSLGSNLGEPVQNLQAAVSLLRATPRLEVVSVSGVYRTAPVGFADQPDFWNIVVLADTTLSAPIILDRAHAIEDGLGRIRVFRNGPRTVDVDIIVISDQVMKTDELVVPHPRAHERAFVLVPWLEVDPEGAIPGKGRVDRILSTLDTSGVERCADLVIT